MAEAGLSIDLDGLLQTQSVQVVQTIDVDSLKQTLRWILGKLQSQESSATPGAAELQSQVQQLAQDNATLRQEIADLKAQQVLLGEQLDGKLDKDQLPSAAIPSLLTVPDEVAALQQRMEAVEGAAAAAGQGGEGAAAASGASAERIDALEASLQELRRGLGEASGIGSARVASARVASATVASARAASARDSGSPRPGSGRGGDGNGDSDAAVGDVGSTSARQGSARGSGADVAPVLGEDVSALRQALAELQEQVQAKADQRSVQDLQTQTEAMREQLSGLQPEQLQLQLESSVREIAALSTRVRDLDEDRSVGLEALEAAVAALKEAVAGKADGDKVDKLAEKLSNMGVALADKADKSAVDELRLRMSLAGAVRPGSVAGSSGLGSPGGTGAASPRGGSAGPGAGAGAGAGGNEGLIQLIQSMLADKAGKAEVAALKEIVDGKAGLGDLEAVRMQLIVDGAGAGGAAGDGVTMEELRGNYARKDDLGRLADQVGDMYAEVERMRHDLVQRRTTSSLGVHSKPSSARGQAGAKDAEAGVQLQPGQTMDTLASVQALSGDLQALRDQVEMVAHATNILAVGLEARAAASTGSGPASPMPHASLAPNSTGGRESRQAAGAYDRLLKLLGSQSVTHKMDHFDPEVLNRMAQKMATVDVMLKSPGFGQTSGVEDLGVRELEAQMRKVTRDIRAMKERVAQGLPILAEGDHAMLAGKPAVLGYRCMACDRPIDKLDNNSGPHLPTYQMSAKMHQMKIEAAKGGPKNVSDSPPGTSRKKAPYDPSQRGPQTWYEDGKPLPAEGLPPQDVGPRLAPGGWRASASGKSGLPDMPPGAMRPVSPQVAATGDHRAGRGGPAGAPIYDLPRIV